MSNSYKVDFDICEAYYEAYKREDNKNLTLLIKNILLKQSDNKLPVHSKYIDCIINKYIKDTENNLVNIKEYSFIENAVQFNRYFEIKNKQKSNNLCKKIDYKDPDIFSVELYKIQNIFLKSIEIENLVKVCNSKGIYLELKDLNILLRTDNFGFAINHKILNNIEDDFKKEYLFQTRKPGGVFIFPSCRGNFNFKRIQLKKYGELNADRVDVALCHICWFYRWLGKRETDIDKINDNILICLSNKEGKHKTWMNLLRDKGIDSWHKFIEKFEFIGEGNFVNEKGEIIDIVTKKPIKDNKSENITKINDNDKKRTLVNLKNMIICRTEIIDDKIKKYLEEK